MGTQKNALEACAPKDPLQLSWSCIPWSVYSKRVRKLQFRIAKAFREGRTGKMNVLQRLLTRSLAAKALAVKRVTENKGKQTPGVDHVLWKTPEERFKAVLSLSRRGYKALPLRRVFIPKKNGKLRGLGIPTMKDRAMQALFLMALIPVAEEKADPNSYGFRPCRSTADAIEQCFIQLSRSFSPRWVLEGDITGCFDNIRHDWLMTHVPTDKGILRKWLAAGYFHRQTLFPTTAGTPQGGIITPRTQCITSLRTRRGGGVRPLRIWSSCNRSPADRDRMADRERIVSHGDLFEKKPRDAALFGDVDRSRILLQTFPKRGQDVRKLERGRLVEGHGFQGQDFILGGLAPSLQGWHALSQLLERHEPFLVGGQEALHAVSQTRLLLRQGFEAPICRVRMPRCLLPPFQLVFDQGRVV